MPTPSAPAVHLAGRPLESRDLRETRSARRRVAAVVLLAAALGVMAAWLLTHLDGRR